ncbi:polysaccharide deacetylase family protein [Candidatus Photodesmus anomalopis]|uniref:Polysaccharide deacetylase n=1 Tax=Candidatus Photodesmus katoptron Akat1 TaxID=1236703 RepID=S3DHQ4_9GAMM|nr:polysaccharide deacetylase family protein [Candidatus Photodesmus katoptron]EPE37977.1 polysaccharide deacetylase [Candidatus Photodesmus katoptron Akat1]
MNILMALSQLEITGAEVYATTIGNTLTNRGHNIHYVSDTLTKSHEGKFHKLNFNKRSIIHRLYHLIYLLFLIKKHNIQLVHAHSRASSWICHIACKLSSIPMITTIHGYQPVHWSRKVFYAIGDKALTICEAVHEQLIHDLKIPPNYLQISRNGIEIEKFSWQVAPNNKKPIISIIGRLTGEKGRVYYNLLNKHLNLEKYHIQLISSSTLKEPFSKISSKISFLGYLEDIVPILAHSDLVIGSGRVAIESLLCGRPTLAIGEAGLVGLIDETNINQAMITNFGDIYSKTIINKNLSDIKNQIKKGLDNKYCLKSIRNQIKQNYNLYNIVNQVEKNYQTLYMEKLLKKTPIIMYHRFIQNNNEKGVHGTYLHVDMLEKHFKLLKWMGFESLTFEDLANIEFIRHLNIIKPVKRYIIITVDDGYEDNYHLLLPLLKKYNFKAIIYTVTGEKINRWDTEVTTCPEIPIPLMTNKQLKTISNSGYIEIGGHTLTHPRLNTLNFEQQQYEIEKNKIYLEALLDKKLTSFAYPYGTYNQDSENIIKEVGYKFAVITNEQSLNTNINFYQIPRIAIFPRTTIFGLWRKLH